MLRDRLQGQGAIAIRQPRGFNHKRIDAALAQMWLSCSISRKSRTKWSPEFPGGLFILRVNAMIWAGAVETVVLPGHSVQPEWLDIPASRCGTEYVSCNHGY